MKLNKLSQHLIILLAAILFAVLFDIKALSWFWEVNWDESRVLNENDLWKVGAKSKLNAIAWSFLVFIVSFYALVVSNILLYSKLVSKGRSNHLMAIQLILANALLFTVISILGSWLVESTYNTDAIIRIKNLLNVRYTLIFVISISFSYLLIFFQKSKLAELDNIRLHEEKAKAELASLKDQISPHFFFNTLNSLSALIRTSNKQESIEFVENLSEVYRYTLDGGMKDLVPIAEELSFIDAYYELLKKRFGDNLNLYVEIDEAQKQNLIPPMALQVLVENVIKHNKLTQKNPINVDIRYQDDYLIVENTIQKKEVDDSNGLGLANLNKRYQMLTNKEIVIQIDEKVFRVKLPIVKA